MKKTVKKYGTWALIAGGSAGIGFAFAQELARKGHNLILVARGQEALDSGAKTLIEAYGIEVETIAMDLAAPGAVEDLHRQTRIKNPGLIVLSAAIDLTGHFTRMDAQSHRTLIDLNVKAPADMARLFGQDMVARGRGGIIFLSSGMGYQGVPLLANYSASKAYILTLGEALHVEMKPFGVDVLVVSPGLTDTDMPVGIPIDFGKLPLTMHKPSKVARIGLRSLGRKASVVPGLLNWIFTFENRLMPRTWPIRMFGFLMKFAMHKDRKSELLNVKAKRVRV